MLADAISFGLITACASASVIPFTARNKIMTAKPPAEQTDTMLESCQVKMKGMKSS